ncbi:MAG: CoA transferase [Dehalococcoidia bacterium]|nr:CoA transferase [Dehalococcoidia bacterium]MDH4366931.1 CoA transferase [Dehalococcoidia bacterium]
MLALEGVKILDLSMLVPGAFCTMLLGDLGADVLKVEAPGVNEFRGSSTALPKEERRKAAAHYALDRNKKSIVVNLKSEAGREIFYRLSQRADVIVEGFRPGVAKRLRIDYGTISKLNPGIVYCSLSGYGQDGPYHTFPGHDVNYIAMAGVLGLIGFSEGPPAVPLNLIADFAGAALYGALGISVALVARNKTGKGQYVDMAYMDGAISLMNWFNCGYLLDGSMLKRGESWLHGAYPYYGVYETKDGKYITIGCLEPHFWENLCRLLGREEYIPYRFALEHTFHKPEGEKWHEIRSSLKQVFLTRTRDEWFELLIRNDVPAGKVYTPDEVFSDPQVLHRQMVIEVEHPTLGKIKQVGIAPKLSSTPGKVRSLSPLPGEHTDEILQGLGYKQRDIKNLRQEGVVY